MPYTTENNVRLRNGFFEEEHFSAQEMIDNSIELEDPGYDIILLSKKGVAQTESTHFSFIPPSSITLIDTGVGVLGDSYIVLYSTELNSTIIDIYLNQSTSIVKAALEQQYESEMTDWEDLDGVATPTEPAGNPNAPILIQSITADLAGCELSLTHLRHNEGFDPKVMSELRMQKKMLMGMLDDIQSGDLKISGLEVPLLVGRIAPKIMADMPVLTNIEWSRENRRIGRRAAVPRNRGGAFFQP